MRVGRVVDTNQRMGARMRHATAPMAAAAASPPNPLSHAMSGACQLMSAPVSKNTTQNWVQCAPIPATGSNLLTRGIPIIRWYLDVLLLIDEYILLIFIPLSDVKQLKWVNPYYVCHIYFSILCVLHVL
jgi:hypothetical protein